MKHTCTEIFKLKDMLQKAGIEFLFLDESFTGFQHYQIKVFEKQRQIISVIQSDGSYGQEHDLLEIMGLLTAEEWERDGVSGYLTADNVFERIKNWKKRNKQ